MSCCSVATDLQVLYFSPTDDLQDLVCSYNILQLSAARKKKRQNAPRKKKTLSTRHAPGV